MVRHGVDGWELADYDWDEKTGIARMVYERMNRVTRQLEEETICKPQPHDTKHVGWYTQ